MGNFFGAIVTQGPLVSRLLDLLAFVNYDDIFLGLFNSAGGGEKPFLYMR
jgi:hypothetical protein